MTIPLEVLRAIRVVVSHRYPENACADGLSASMIIKDVLPDAEYRFFAHNTREYDELTPEPGMLFVDITPPSARVNEFRDLGSIVLDHHKDREDLVASFKERGVFAHEERDPGVSGALLAFEHVWLPLTAGVGTPSKGVPPEVARSQIEHCKRREKNVEQFATLAGVRDTWQRASPLWKEASEQAAVLLFFPIEDWLNSEPLDAERLAQRMEIGPHLIARFERETEALLKSAYRFTTEKGTRVVVLPSTRISDAAERFNRGDGHDADVVVGFAFHVEGGKPSMRLSLRSFKGSGGKLVDVSAIARLFPGGGGHTHAAGTSVRLGDPTYGTDVNYAHPYAIIHNLMARF